LLLGLGLGLGLRLGLGSGLWSGKGSGSGRGSGCQCQGRKKDKRAKRFFPPYVCLLLDLMFSLSSFIVYPHSLSIRICFNSYIHLQTSTTSN
jgi:hypothetical protein